MALRVFLNGYLFRPIGYPGTLSASAADAVQMPPSRLLLCCLPLLVADPNTISRIDRR